MQFVTELCKRSGSEPKLIDFRGSWVRHCWMFQYPFLHVCLFLFCFYFFPIRAILSVMGWMKSKKLRWKPTWN